MSELNVNAALAVLTIAAGCSSEGSGTARFTTWGEEYIEMEIPPDPEGEDGFVDGWTLHFDKFLIAIHGITVASSNGEVAAAMGGSRLVDNARPGKKELVSFADVPAKAWDAVGYQVKPALADSILVGATEADRAMMVGKGHSLYVEGFATRPGAAAGQVVKKTFHWGFSTATQYSHCQQAEEGGHAVKGIVVTSGGIDTSELTTHGDHFFYDRLQASDDQAKKTRLRFDALAAADTNGDGEITLEELHAAPIDVTTYDPTPFEAPNLGAFMTALTRTVGHFRGEGECSASVIR
jgi:hypothetical protein